MSAMNSRDKIIHLIALSPGIYIMTAMWLIPEGYKYVPVAIILAILAFLALKGWNHLPRASTNPRKPYVILILVSAFWFGLTYKINDGSISQLRTLASVSVYMALVYRYEFPLPILRASVSTSCFILSLICLYQFFFLDINRATLNYNPIPFATGLAFFMAVSCALAFREEGCVNSLDITAALLSLAAIATTGTRGVLAPAILVALISICWGMSVTNLSGKVKAVVASLLLTSLLGGSLYVSQGRIELTIADFEKIQEGEYSGSIGLRVQFWRGAVELASLNPFTGIGNQHFEEFQRLGELGQINQQAMEYAPYHYHNQYLDDLVKRGTPGFAILLATLVLPVVLSLKRTPRNSWQRRSISLIVMITATAGLTDVPLNHPPVIFTFFVLTFCLLPAMRSNERQHITRR